MKIYIVTSGDYDEYHTNAVFDNAPAAQAYARKYLGGNDHDIEIWPVNPADDDFRIDVLSGGEK